MPYKLLLIILVVIVIIVLVLSFSNFYFGIRPAKFVSKTTPADLNLKYENVELTTEDGIKLDAWFIPAKTKTNKTVIVLHGYPFDKGNILPHGSFLHNGFNLLLFDFRYLGKNEGSYSSVGFHEQKDLRAAVDYLRSRNQTKVGAFGFSLGGAVALMEAKQSKINAIVSDSSYSSLEKMLKEVYGIFGIFKFPFVMSTKILSKVFLGIDLSEVSPENSIKELDAPIMIIHGSDDDQISVDNAYRLKNANPEAELWITQGTNHNDPRKKDYENRVLKFFKDNLK